MVELDDLLYAGVSGVAGAASIGKGAFRQERHVRFLDDLFQVGGNTHVSGELLHSVDGGLTVFLLGHIVHAFYAHGFGQSLVLLAAVLLIIFHTSGQDDGAGHAVGSVIEADRP